MADFESESLTGKIVKGIGGFYYVYVPDAGVFECRAKGVFRAKDVKPLVGDECVITVLDPEKKLGNLVEIKPRKNGTELQSFGPHADSPGKPESSFFNLF